jgi:hypothetical protein
MSQLSKRRHVRALHKLPCPVSPRDHIIIHVFTFRLNISTAQYLNFRAMPVWLLNARSFAPSARDIERLARQFLMRRVAFHEDRPV